MITIKRQIITLGLLYFHTASLLGQGITRTYGLGLRGGFWKTRGDLLSVSVSSSSSRGSVDIGGMGGSLYFFSRLKQQWFLETSIGANTNVHVEEKDFFSDNVDAAVLSPFLFGCRFDVLPTRVASSFQPYVSAGLGPYWMIKTRVEEKFIEDDEVSVQSDIIFGGYTGGGLHLTVSSRFAFNLDLRYHFVEWKPDHNYSGLELGLGFCFMWGRKRELFRVKEIKLQDIYPAYYQFYNTYPIAWIRIQNTVGYPIEVNVKSNIKGYSERIQESGFTEISKGEIKDIPVRIIFGPRLLESTYNASTVIDLEIEARSGVIDRKTISAQVMVHSRNAWNGEIDKLRFFITPENEKILELSRKVVKQLPNNTPTVIEKFTIAKALFHELKGREIQYLSDPNIPFYQDDRVQFAMNTLNLGSGDCDDLAVLYASLLESQGIETAFVDVHDPEKTIAHLYLLVNTDLSPEKGFLISSNEKRFVIRKRNQNSSSIWIPVETTLIQKGFEEAWKAGATQYLQEGILRHGIIKGWVKIIDVQ